MKNRIETAAMLLALAVLLILGLFFVVYYPAESARSKTLAVTNAIGRENLSIVELIPRIKSGVVHIDCSQWQGSGFVIGPNLIMTARHCVEGVEDFEITTDDEHKLHATRALSSNNHDIGFIYIDDLTCVAENCENDGVLLGEHKVQLHTLKLGSITGCQLGEKVITISSPLGSINFNTASVGIIAALDRDYDVLNSYGDDYGWNIAFQTTAPTEGGSSGCPIFSMDGTVRGILVGGWTSTCNIAMPVDIVLEEIELVRQKFIMGKYYIEEEESEDPYYNYHEDTEYYELVK